MSCFELRPIRWRPVELRRERRLLRPQYRYDPANSRGAADWAGGVTIPTVQTAQTTNARRVWDDEALRHPHEQADKAGRVRRMFNAIAPTYERVNTLSSFGRDQAWRRCAVALAELRPTDRVLDIACGTGDLSRAFANAGAAEVVGADFAGDMVALAAARPMARTRWCQSDALALPFRAESFDVVSCAF